MPFKCFWERVNVLKGKFEMIEFTYERQNRKNIYETYEWDNTWIEHADGSDAKRVLYIGDSISCQIRQLATKLTEEQVLFDGYGSSKGIDNPYLIDSIKLFALQEGHREAVLFNNGLHGWHLDDETEYKEAYEEVVVALRKEFADIPVVLVLTTHVGNTEDEKRVIARNKAVLEIAEKYNLHVIDLYAESLKQHDDLDEWGVHFGEKGNISLAKKLAMDVKEVIKRL